MSKLRSIYARSIIAYHARANVSLIAFHAVTQLLDSSTEYSIRKLDSPISSGQQDRGRRQYSDDVGQLAPVIAGQSVVTQRQ